MKNTYSNKQNDPKLLDTIKSDFRQEDIFKKIRREFKDLKEFYLDSEKKLRLEQMNPVKKVFYIIWWILKSMILKLNPLRRILLLIGIVLVLLGRVIVVNNEDVSTARESLFGTALILIVLMLELKDKLLAHDELGAGRQVQNALMPELSPQVDGWLLWLFTRSANEVGGDLVDFIKITDNRLAVVIADVAGKGLKAALLTAKLQATIRALAFDYNSIALLISKVSEIFHRDTLRSMFASLLYVEFIPNSGKVRFINAGHFPPLLIKKDDLQELPKGEAALGLLNKTSYTEQLLEMEKDDILVAYSDGLIEARSQYGTFFGSQKFLDSLKSLKHLPPNEIGQAIVSQVDNFIGDAPTFDDLSIVILKRC
jgi:serine phosphatase RsbU (regulator of sigma subunit)